MPIATVFEALRNEAAEMTLDQYLEGEIPEGEDWLAELCDDIQALSISLSEEVTVDEVAPLGISLVNEECQLDIYREGDKVAAILFVGRGHGNVIEEYPG